MLRTWSQGVAALTRASERHHEHDFQASEIRDLSTDDLDAVTGGAFSFGIGCVGINVGSNGGGSVHFMNGGNADGVGKDGSIENLGPSHTPK